MTYTVITRAIADEQIAEAYDKYDVAGYGMKFLDDLELCFDVLRRNPYSCSVDQGNAPMRKALLKKFPFRVVYEVVGTQIIIYDVTDIHRDRK